MVCTSLSRYSRATGDDAAAKWKCLEKVCTDFSEQKKRPAQLWLDRACLDQANITESLAYLPVHLAGCRELLILAGPSYTTRLWTLLEIFVFVQMVIQRDCRRGPSILHPLTPPSFLPAALSLAPVRVHDVQCLATTLGWMRAGRRPEQGQSAPHSSGHRRIPHPRDARRLQNCTRLERRLPRRGTHNTHSAASNPHREYLLEPLDCLASSSFAQTASSSLPARLLTLPPAPRVDSATRSRSSGSSRRPSARSGPSTRSSGRSWRRRVSRAPAGRAGGARRAASSKATRSRRPARRMRPSTRETDGTRGARRARVVGAACLRTGLRVARERASPRSRPKLQARGRRRPSDGV